MSLVEMMDKEANKLGLVQTKSSYVVTTDSSVCVYHDPIAPDKAVAVSISGLEEMQNAGADRLRDLVQARVKNARLSLDALRERA